MAKLVAAGLFLLALAGSAAAADIRAPVRKAPPAPLPPSWTGFYVGAHVGYGWDDRDVNLAGADPHVLFSFPPLPDLRFPSRGPLGGFQLGFNWQLAPQWLIGLEADFSWASIKGDATAAYSIPPVLLGPIIPAADAASERIRSLGTVRGRLGVLAAPDVLLYVTGGYAYGRVEHTATNTLFFNISSTFAPFSYVCTNGVPCFVGSSSRVRSGWTAGLGGEWALWNGVTLKAEYLHIDLGGEIIPVVAVATTPAGPVPGSFNGGFSRTQIETVRIGLNWRLGTLFGPGY